MRLVGAFLLDVIIEAYKAARKNVQAPNFYGLKGNFDIYADVTYTDILAFPDYVKKLPLETHLLLPSVGVEIR